MTGCDQLPEVRYDGLSEDRCGGRHAVLMASESPMRERERIGRPRLYDRDFKLDPECTVRGVCGKYVLRQKNS